MSEGITREEAKTLLAGEPWKLLQLFGIGRDEFLEALMDRLVRELKDEVGGTLGALFPLDQKQAEFISGLGREALLSSEHIDGGNRAKRWTVDQALRARDGRTRNKEKSA